MICLIYLTSLLVLALDGGISKGILPFTLPFLTLNMPQPVRNNVPISKIKIKDFLGILEPGIN